MPQSRILTVAGSAALLSLVLAGCGGSDTLTAKEFKTKAQAICKAADKDTDAMGDDLGDSPTEDQFLKAIDKLVDRNEKMVKDIDALKPPKSLEKDVAALLKEVKAALKKIDDASLSEINAMENPFTKANELATDLGLDDCSAG